MNLHETQNTPFDLLNIAVNNDDDLKPLKLKTDGGEWTATHNQELLSDAGKLRCKNTLEQDRKIWPAPEAECSADRFICKFQFAIITFGGEKTVLFYIRSISGDPFMI
jgi:hypothetical protein